MDRGNLEPQDTTSKLEIWESIYWNWDNYLFLESQKTMGMKLFWVCLSAVVFLEFPQNTSLEEHTTLVTPKYLRMPSANAVDNLTRCLDLCGSEKAQVHIQDSFAFLTLQFDKFSPSFFFTFKLYFCSSPLSWASTTRTTVRVELFLPKHTAKLQLASSFIHWPCALDIGGPAHGSEDYGVAYTLRNLTKSEHHVT